MVSSATTIGNVVVIGVVVVAAGVVEYAVVDGVTGEASSLSCSISGRKLKRFMF